MFVIENKIKKINKTKERQHVVVVLIDLIEFTNGFRAVRANGSCASKYYTVGIEAAVFGSTF